MLFKGVKKIPKIWPTQRPDVRAKISRSIRIQHAIKTKEAKAAEARKRSLSMLKHWAQNSLKVHEDKEYRRYQLSRLCLEYCTPEEREMLKKRGVGSPKITEEEKKDWLARSMHKHRDLVESNVPRKKNYCGVVHEDIVEEVFSY